MQEPELAAGGGDGDRVLEGTTGVGVVLLDAHRCGAEGRPEGTVVEHGAREVSQALVRDVFGQELEEALEVVDVAARTRRELERVGRDFGLLDGAHHDLRAATVLLHAAEYADDVADLEAPVENGGVVEDRGLDAARLVGQLEREIRRARARTTAILADHGKRRVDELSFDEIADGGAGFCGHVMSLVGGVRAAGWIRGVGCAEEDVPKGSDPFGTYPRISADQRHRGCPIRV